jgi:hypothetical protein
LLEDFPEQSGWIDKLILPINSHIERVVGALNRSLTLTENLAADIKTVELSGTLPARLSWGLAARPVAVLVGGWTQTTGAAVPVTEAVQVQWSFTQNGQLSIDAVFGITPTAARKYKLTLVCLTG